MPDPRILDALIKGAIEQQNPAFHFGNMSSFLQHLGTAKALGYLDGDTPTPKGIERYQTRNLEALPACWWTFWPQ